ncbi:neurofilament heavy polypeptide [Asbolus verrucosus]|uniref:Neurofilament heavy polypeptide n=1 Tax=Asbolus verrucosus TaxID=1661398 RepID=A0A482WDJ0_ASBVE|nr:neurofilament heavy polypeptide [Asbolus verrucosus]
METSVETASEINSIDASAELPPKEEPVDREVEVVTPPVSESIPELMQSEKSGTSDKELSWEKIAAEFTEDEEEDVKPPEKQTPDAQPEPETSPNPTSNTQISIEVQDKTVHEEIVEETVIVSKSVTESSEKTVETVNVESEPVKEVVEELSASEQVVDSEPVKENVEPVSEVIELSEDDSIKEAPVLEKEPEEPPSEAPAEEVVEKESLVKITELKPGETPAIIDPADEVEYTVIEADDVETNEIIEEHLAQTNTETVVIINPDHSQTEITIEQVDESDKNDVDEVYLVAKDNEVALDDPSEEHEPEGKDVKPKKQRGRKPIADIPLHVLGRDITKPTEGVSNGGRSMPKPRLGVKVPYRNLTSQIVSKEEIEKEIMERFKLKQEQNTTSSGDILFARKLTQRLAKKLIPSERDKSHKPSESTSSVANQKEPQLDAEIKNNSDLIAILEGEGDDIQLTKQQEPSEPSKEPMDKISEKEIALQQLKELPVAKNKFFKNRSEEEKKPQIQPVKLQPKAEWTPVKTAEKKNQEVEPRLKTGMVIKTYTRKRKSSDLETILPPKKSVMVATTIKSEDGPPTNVYITKSSRVIKRKVIWDPDEIPAKSPIRSPKSEGTPVKSPIKSPKSETPVAKPVEKNIEKKIPVPVKKIVSKSPPPKKPKRLTEVDKLLMDEGAVNMLYDVKTNDDATPLKKKNNNKSMISLDKAHKELMSKTNVIKNDLQQNTNKDVQKSLRKKEVATPSPPKKEAPSPRKEAVPVAVTRKKSKDSARSSVHSPPASPTYNAAEASRIIRRHSSSSFSSNDEVDEENGEERVTRRKSSVAMESPKKKMKKTVEAKPAKEVAKNNNNTVTENKDKSFSQYKSFTATRKNKLVSIKLSKVNSKHYFTDQVLKELTGCLKELGKDDECHVVSLTSDSNDSFCHGLDYRFLVADDENVRKKKATELSSLVKEFLRCLLNFPKVLVAGIQGDCVGLGVTMLPLFDMVVASDTSTFSTPYARLGCIPEAGFLLTVPHLGSHGLASELLYTSQVVKADDAFRRGLVTRLCWPEKYHEEFNGLLSLVANQPRENIVATKQQLRSHLVQSTEASISSATKALVEHWTSPECQRIFLK